MHRSIDPKLFPKAGLICSQQATNQVPAHAVGCFKLSAGRAMSLTPQVPGELRMAHGRAWVTFANAANDSTARAGDHFLAAGDLLRLQAGQHLVLEMIENNPQQSVYFSWEPDTVLSLEASPRQLQLGQAEVRQPLLDLGAALHQAGWALGRLVYGLAAHAVCTLTLRRSTP